MKKKIVAALIACLAATACDRSPASVSAEPTATATPTSTQLAQPHPETAAVPIDPAVVEAATKVKPESAEGVVKASFPRDDVKIEVDGWAMPPFMGLTSWAGFTPGQKPGVEAMVMGDFVVFEDEVFDVMKTLLDAGIQVTALHNHFFYDKPNVFFMHIEGEGKTDALAKGVRGAIDAEKAIRAKAPQPRDRSEGPAIPPKSSIDGAKVETAIGVKGTAKDGMYKVTVGRPATTAACGCKIGKVMGVNTWAAFAGTDDNAIVDGDFAVAEDELQPVLKALVGRGIHVVAIHHHMVGEQPRILFLHYWGRGSVTTLATDIKGALALTKTGG